MPKKQVKFVQVPEVKEFVPQLPPEDQYQEQDDDDMDEGVEPANPAFVTPASNSTKPLVVRVWKKEEKTEDKKRAADTSKVRTYHETEPCLDEEGLI